jgi:hypothetical protein
MSLVKPHRRLLAYEDELRAALAKIPTPTFAELLKQGDEMVSRVRMAPDDLQAQSSTTKDRRPGARQKRGGVGRQR